MTGSSIGKVTMWRSSRRMCLTYCTMAVVYGAALLCFCSLAHASPANPVVQTKYGSVVGLPSMSSAGRTFLAFSGVPYAKPPTGDLRFKPPEEPDSWEGVRDATKEGPDCIQLDMFQQLALTGEEDCLYLNVYTPKISEDGDKPLDVFVWIHGGGLMCGSGSTLFYGPKYFMDRDVVLVSINYRLGALGFLNTGDKECPGNMGLKDQNMALRWVRDNIAAFGGNPSSVTIFGESAGGSSVHLHMLSPMSQGLFHRAISQSGTALCPWAHAEHPESRAAQLGFLVGCPTDSSSALMACLQKLDAEPIVRAYKDMLKFTFDPVSPFSATVEPESDNAFLTADPYSIIQSGKFARVPWMTGVTSHEGGVRLPEFLENDYQLMKQLDKDFMKIAPITLTYEDTALDSDDVSKKVRKFYFGDKPIAEDTIDELSNMYSDRDIVHCTYVATHAHANSRGENSPIYFYVFNYRGKYSISIGNTTRDFGVVHMDDLIYLFNGALAPEFTENTPEKVMSKKVLDLWINFAKHGNPTPRGSLVKWPSVHFAPDIHLGVPKFPHLDIHPEMRVSWDFPYSRMQFWNSLPIDENGRRGKGDGSGHM